MYMDMPSSQIMCDGCGLPASREHIAERLRRLELATRFRPVHLNVLFIAAAPLVGPENDFYRPPESREFFDSFMEAVEARVPENKIHAGAVEGDAARLVEFQRRGYYLAYLSECPLPAKDDAVNSAISRLGSTLIRRIRFNYKPKHIVILGGTLGPLRAIFENTALSSTLLHLLEMPTQGNTVSAAQFSAALASLTAGGSGPV